MIAAIATHPTGVDLISVAANAVTVTAMVLASLRVVWRFVGRRLRGEIELVMRPTVVAVEGLTRAVDRLDERIRALEERT